MKTSNFIVLLGAGGLLAYYLIKKGAAAINPLNPNNVANTSFNALYQGVTGSQGSLGTDLYNTLNPYNPNSGTSTYFVYDANGNLTRDSSGNLVLSSYPPGSTQNPYPNPNG